MRAEVRGPSRVAGTLRPPGDKSISHRALLLASLAKGVSRIEGLNAGRDVEATAEMIRLLGCTTKGSASALEVRGPVHQVHPEEVRIDCGNSGSTMRLGAGVVASLAGRFVLLGDESLSSRPMGRIAVPLSLMGATVRGRSVGEELYPPIEVTGGKLSGITYEMPIASAQVKGCLMFAALRAEGPTVIVERGLSRRHSEELFEQLGLPIKVRELGEARVIELEPADPPPFRLVVPRDPSAAAPFVVAACTAPFSELVVEGMYEGVARTDYLAVLQRMGARIERKEGLVSVSASELVATEVAPEEVPAVVDEVPVLAVAAARARGVTVFRGLAELRVKESDRVAAVAGMLSSFGVRAEAGPDWLEVEGRPEGWLRACVVDPRGDHRIAMAGAVAGLCAEGRTEVVSAECVDVSYPGFFEVLGALSGGAVG